MPDTRDCPLCRRIADLDRDGGDALVWKFPHSIAMLGPWQFYTGYCVLVSREHATELSGLGTNRTAFLEEMSLLAAAIEACFHPHKLNYELLGNLVPHLHWHLFPRSADDPEKLRPVWFAIDRAENDPTAKPRLESGTLTREESVTRLRAWLTANGAAAHHS
jgi:diadenosine tetraphosphate (Ap4A) HIT family hydrolase